MCGAAQNKLKKRNPTLVFIYTHLLSFKWNLIRLSGPAHGIVLKIWLSYHLHVQIDIMLCLKGRVLRLGKTVHKTLPEALKHSV